MAIGVIRPQEDQAIEVEVSQVAAAPISTNIPDAEQQQTPATTPACDSATPRVRQCRAYLVISSRFDSSSWTEPTPIFEQEEDDGLEEEQKAIDHPRLRQMI